MMDSKIFSGYACGAIIKPNNTNLTYTFEKIPQNTAQNIYNKRKNLKVKPVEEIQDLLKNDRVRISRATKVSSEMELDVFTSVLAMIKPGSDDTELKHKLANELDGTTRAQSVVDGVLCASGDFSDLARYLIEVADTRFVDHTLNDDKAYPTSFKFDVYQKEFDDNGVKVPKICCSFSFGFQNPISIKEGVIVPGVVISCTNKYLDFKDIVFTNDTQDMHEYQELAYHYYRLILYITYSYLNRLNNIKHWYNQNRDAEALGRLVPEDDVFRNLLRLRILLEQNKKEVLEGLILFSALESFDATWELMSGCFNRSDLKGVIKGVSSRIVSGSGVKANRSGKYSIFSLNRTYDQVFPVSSRLPYVGKIFARSEPILEFNLDDTDFDTFLVDEMEKRNAARENDLRNPSDEVLSNSRNMAH